jgi:hypothetical protein
MTGAIRRVPNKTLPSGNIKPSLTQQLVQFLYKLANRHHAKWQTLPSSPCDQSVIARGSTPEPERHRTMSWNIVHWRSLGKRAKAMNSTIYSRGIDSFPLYILVRCTTVAASRHSCGHCINPLGFEPREYACRRCRARSRGSGEGYYVLLERFGGSDQSR